MDIIEIFAHVQSAEADHLAGVRLDEVAAIVVDDVVAPGRLMLRDVVRQQRLREVGVLQRALAQLLDGLARRIHDLTHVGG